MFELILIAASLLPSLECHVVDGEVPADVYEIQDRKLRRKMILAYTGIGVEVSDLDDEYGIIVYLDGDYDPGVAIWGQCLEQEWRLKP